MMGVDEDLEEVEDLTSAKKASYAAEVELGGEAGERSLDFGFRGGGGSSFSSDMFTNTEELADWPIFETLERLGGQS